MTTRPHHPRRLLFAAYPMGYGPAAKVLVLAAQCRSAGLEAVFVGEGVAHELVSRSGELFHDVVRAGAGEKIGRILVRESSAVVSVMDRDFASLAAELSRPLHVVDSLLWMRDAVPEAFCSARRYWVQNFIGVRERIAGYSSPYTVVGPILEVRPAAPRAEPGKLVVSLGGFEAADGVDRDRVYGELVLAAISSSRLRVSFEERITILTSTRNVDSLGGFAAECGIELKSLSHHAALDELGTASMVLAAPGLTTALECFQLGRPTFFLPPRNYSQWSILNAFRTRRLALHALHWEDLSERHRLGERMPESERNPQVRAAIDELAGGMLAQETLSERLSACLDSDHAALANRQHEFFQSLGPNGASVIATRLGSEIDP